ncbi:MAG: 1-deoxy-D-xylulose-5-phosphate synthase, partial [Oscillospiraceae bacterium]|nr:1-deoxy-D-xylulose-5-phosphate synthase [Oscillospiraceae bacterium]
PRGGEGRFSQNSGIDAAVCLRRGTDITLAGYGILINQLLEAAELLQEQGVSAEVIKLNEVGAGLDTSFVSNSVRRTKRLLVLEDCIMQGSVGQQLAAALVQEQVETEGVWLQNLQTQFAVQGTVSQLYERYGLTAQTVLQKALELCRESGKNI